MVNIQGDFKVGIGMIDRHQQFFNCNPNAQFFLDFPLNTVRDRFTRLDLPARKFPQSPEQTFWFSPIGNYFSRKHEYEADGFARDAMGGPAAMVGALRKLAQKNLTNLTPHPWYSGFHYSHPTLVERERSLQTASV